MKRQIIAAALLLTLGLTATSHADPYDKTIVPADSVAVVHVNFQGMLQTTFGKLVVADLKAVGLDEKIDELKSEFGLDPLVDLNSVTVAVKSYAKGDGVMIVRMSTNVNKLRELVRLNEHYAASEHNGSTVHSWIDKKCDPDKRKYCGDITPEGRNETLLVFGENLTRVHEAMDVIAGTKRSLNGVKEGVLAIEPAEGANVFIVATDLQAMPEAERQNKKMLKLTESIVVNMGEKKDSSFVDIDLTAKSAGDAQSMRAIVEGMLALVAFSDNEHAKELAVLTNDITVGGEEKLVTIDFSHDARNLHARLKAMHEAKHGKRAAEEE